MKFNSRLVWFLMVFCTVNVWADPQDNACSEDQKKFCGTIPQAGGRMMACLDQHIAELSQSCREMRTRGPIAAPGGSHSMPGASRSTQTGPAAKTSQELIRRAQQNAPEYWKHALARGAKIKPTPDGRSFYVVWTPPGKKISETPVLVGLHGHGSWAVNEFTVWYEPLRKHGYSIVAPQWWFGGGETTEDYYATRDLSRLFDQILTAEHVTPGRAILHGFNRGATQTYGLTALDNQRARPYFIVSVANAGGAAMDFPLNRSIDGGEFGPKPFVKSTWVLFCGGQDPNPDGDGCPAMDRTKAWIEHLGGTRVLLIKDASAGHGGFHRNPAHVEKALHFIDSRLAAGQ